MPRLLRDRCRGLLVLLALALGGCTSLKELQQETINDFRLAVAQGKVSFPVPPGTKVDSVIVDSLNQTLTVRFSKEFSTLPFRPGSVRAINSGVVGFFSDRFKGYSVSVRALNWPLEVLIPNYYREPHAVLDTSRMPPRGEARPAPLIENLSSPFHPSAGLQERYITLWPSHGWYYNNKETRWEWQRPRLFQSVEDLIPLSVTLPYLIPMLEHAGATVFVPRERDTQKEEVVVDNDAAGGSYRENVSREGISWTTGDGAGFARGSPPYASGENPFRAGTHRVILSDSLISATASWIPDIPESGEYGVSVSFGASPLNVQDAHYSVYHSGGRTDFQVNQQIGGGTWIYLGTFNFSQGVNPGIGRVVLTNASATPGRLVSGDAVRFGGGLGVIQRNGQASGRAKYLEGARYFLQYAGMPDTLVYSLNGDTNDYNDDYQSRAEYANYLHGAPCGPNRDRGVAGLGVPIDLTLAFHTDAGLAHADTVVGTLSIFSTEGADSLNTFPDGVSRLASRDFADLLQTQIVDDLRALFDPLWRRRQLLDSRYSEAYRPNMPGALLELLSHQSFVDMQFMLDPRFRFHVARSIYKGILRFLSFQHRTVPVVQPLPPCAFAAELRDSSAFLQWSPTTDPLEPTARAERYIVYTRIEGRGFDNGTLVNGTTTTIPDLIPGVIYSFQVTAVNAGGESFPSEILSLCRMKGNKPPAMIVNGFDRVSGPAVVASPEFAGFFNLLDAGVPDRVQLNFTGLQHDYDRNSPYRSNDAPGFGASFADREGSIIAGNSFDFPFVHGQALRASGFPFVYSSRDAVVEKHVDLSAYPLVDLILGKQKLTHWQKPLVDSIRGPQFAAFPPRFREVLEGYLGGGGSLFLSGAYLATDPVSAKDSAASLFLRQVLHCAPVTDHAARTGRVTSVLPSFLAPGDFLGFQTEGNQTIYGVESVDALAPVNGGELLLRYSENLFGAAVGYRGGGNIIAMGFPFETVALPEKREELMKAVTTFLLQP